MGRFVAGENLTVFSFESGTYGNSFNSGNWIGLVSNFDPDDNQNVQQLRYHGTSTRNVDKFVPGAEDYGGALEFHPQDLRYLYFALGNVADTEPGSPAFYTHTITELESKDQSPVVSGTQNPFTSWSLESVQCFNATGGNLVRTYKGCVVDGYTLSAEAGTPLTCSVDFIAQSQTFTTGGTTLDGTFKAVTEVTRRPHMWSDSIIHIPSGTPIEAKSWEFSTSNNFDRDGAHVTNGSRVITVPTPTQREHTFSITMEGESTEAARLYGLWKSGGDAVVNAAIEILNFGNAASGNSFITMSGCVIQDFVAPNPVEGIDEWEITLIPKVVSSVTEDNTILYKGW